MISKGLRDLHEVIKLKAKMLVSPSTGNKAVGKPGSFPQWLGPRLRWFVQELVSDLLIP